MQIRRQNALQTNASPFAAPTYALVRAASEPIFTYPGQGVGTTLEDRRPGLKNSARHAYSKAKGLSEYPEYYVELPRGGGQFPLTPPQPPPL